MTISNERKGCLSFLRRNTKPVTESTQYPYAKKGVLTAAEQVFYRSLLIAVQQQAIIFSKVRLIDFLRITEDFYKHKNSITQKHIDFLLCNPQSFQPMIAIELDDKSHRQKDRATRDDFVDKALAAAQLPLLHIIVQQDYDPATIREQIKQATSTTTTKKP